MVSVPGDGAFSTVKEHLSGIEHSITIHGQPETYNDQNDVSIVIAGFEEAGPASEKKSLHATEHDTEENLRRREAFVASLRAVAPEDLIYLDESGVSTQMTRLYARAEGGQRVRATVPGGHWKMLTILGAMSVGGMVATMTVDAATDREVFLAYLD